MSLIKELETRPAGDEPSLTSPQHLSPAQLQQKTLHFPLPQQGVLGSPPGHRSYWYYFKIYIYVYEDQYVRMSKDDEYYYTNLHR